MPSGRGFSADSLLSMKTDAVLTWNMHRQLYGNVLDYHSVTVDRQKFELSRMKSEYCCYLFDVFCVDLQCYKSYRNFFFFSSTTLCSCKCVFPLDKSCFSTQSVSEPFWMWNPHTSVLKETENISYSEKYDWFVFFKLYSLYILIAHPWLWNKTYDRCHAYDFRFFVIFIYIYIF